MKKKKKSLRKKKIDCYGVNPNGVGKITYSYEHDLIPEMKPLGDLGKL